MTDLVAPDRTIYELKQPGPVFDARIADLAARQEGVVAHYQLIQLGLSKYQIHYRARTGRLHRVYRAMQELLARSPGRKGHKPISALLTEATARLSWSRSQFEDHFFDVITQAGMPRPSVNLWVHGFEVDMFWPDAKLIVELDTYEFHGSRSSFESDRRRDAILRKAGYEVLRVTDVWLASDPAGVVETIFEVRRGSTMAA